MFTSLRNRLRVLFLIFFLLVLVSVLTTFWTVDTLYKDAAIINLAGRQRMLIQRMKNDALQIEKGSLDHIESLQEAHSIFNETLWALIEGGQVEAGFDRLVTIPATKNRHILEELHEVHHTWDTFRFNLEILENEEPESPEFVAALEAIEQLSPKLLDQVDHVVLMYESASTQKVTRLMWIQAIFLISAVGLLSTGSLMTRKSILEPLQVFDQAVGRIGQGEQTAPINISEPLEFSSLASTFNTMQGQIKKSREELVAWGTELENRVDQRTRELAALYEVSRDISSHLEISHILQTVTCTACELLEGDAAFLCLLDETQQVLKLGECSGPEEAISKRQMSVNLPLPVQVMEKQSILCNDLENPVSKCSIIATPFCAHHIVANLQVADRTIGALCVGRKERDFVEEDEKLLTKLATSTAIALENARLQQEVEQLAILEERQRIAAEIHDGLAQTLSYLELTTDQASSLVETGSNEQALAELNRVRDIIIQAGKEVRQSIARWQSDPSGAQPLQDHLCVLLNDFSAGAGLPAQFTSTVDTPLIFLTDKTVQITRILQESLQNIRRHADAQKIDVRLTEQETEYMLSITDDGQGFQMENSVGNGAYHFGLSIMKARAARIGGNVLIQSEPGKGTQVILSWPVKG